MSAQRGNKATDRFSPLENVLVTFCAVVLVFVLSEGVLRVIGFSFDVRPRYMEFNFPNPHELHEIFEPDQATLWRLRPGMSMGEGIEPINSMGFRGPEFEEKKSEGTGRVIALGDSVTFGAQVSYPRMLGDCLGPKYQVINAGVPGYSSTQGLKLFRSRLVILRPDIIIVMYGWNDHWLAQGFTDAEQTLKGPRENGSRLIEELRIYQFVHWLLTKSSRHDHTAGPPKRRVPLDEYRKNLWGFVSEAKKDDARVLLLTPPSTLKSGKLPDYLYWLKFIEGDPGEPAAQGVKRVKELHGSYNDVVRGVAAETGAELIDLDRDWGRLELSGLFNDPSRDIIHPSAKGYGLIAKTLCDTIRKAH